MKNFKKVLALLVALMVIAASTTALAGTITITPPSGLQSTDTNVYKIYKVFDAVGNGSAISYSLRSGDTLSAAMEAAGFAVTAGGNVTGPAEATDAVIAAIADYVTDGDLVATLNATGSTPVTSGDLGYGYFYITTSTGALIVIDSTNPDQEVNDKNTVPSLDKKITGASSIDADGKKALAQIGTTVEYTSTITVGKGAIGYEFHDKMDAGLAYDATTLKVKVDGADVPAANYDTTTDTGDTITIKFNDDYTKGLAAGTEIVITYSATITTNALTLVPEKNTAYVKYGNEDSNNKTPDEQTKTYNAKITITKQDGNGNGLGGAGFVLKNSADKFYSISGTTVSWVDSQDSATKYTSSDAGEVEPFIGLPDGDYTLVEVDVPAGYNALDPADPALSFTIAAGDYTADNLEQSSIVINQSGATLPSTGGIGTTIFYVAGSVLVLAAAILLVTKRRMSTND